MSPEGNNDPPGLTVGRVEVVIEVKTCVVTFAYLIVFIEDKGEVTSDRALVDQRQVSFLDYGPRGDPIAYQLYYVESWLGKVSLKREGLFVAQVRRLVGVV